MTAVSLVKAAYRRDRAIVLGGIAVVAALAWLYLIDTAGSMNGIEAVSGAAMANAITLKPWTLSHALMMFVMWAVMMVAMMVPSAAPMILLHATVWRKKLLDGQPYAPAGAFAAGYIVMWTLFSLAATALQWGLEQIALLSPMMVSTSPVFGGLVLIAAGVYQLTPYKRACLRRCRSPIEFLSRRWRNGSTGAFVMGLEHGAYCLGCCWLLMVLLFVGGVMNLLWIAALAIFVLVEKAAPIGATLGRAGAGLLMAAGVTVIALS